MKNHTFAKEFDALISIKKAPELLKAKGRREHGMFLLEGRKMIDEALKAGYRLCASWSVDEVGERAFVRLCDTVTPQGVAAAFELPQMPRSELLQDGRYILLEGLQNPGNVGSIIRTAEALGLSGVLFCGEAVDIFAPKVMRGSMGSALRLPCVNFDTPDDVKAAAVAAGLALLGSSVGDGAKPLSDVKLKRGIIAVGNEGAGMTEKLLSLCDGIVTIPMAGVTESLSAPAAAAILMWELFGKSQ